MSVSTKFEHRAVEDIVPDNLQARRHNKKQIEKALRLFARQGIKSPLVIDEHDRIIDGHLRYHCAVDLRYTELPVVVVTDLSEQQRIELSLSLNRLPQDTVWDQAALKIQLETLLSFEVDLSFTGFEVAELDAALSFGVVTNDPDDIGTLPTEPISQVGDIWKVGNHYLICGNALELSSLFQVLSIHAPSLVVTDPPYNVSVKRHVQVHGHHEEFSMASGEMDDATFGAFLEDFLQNAKTISTSDALFYVFMDWRHYPLLDQAAKDVGFIPRNLCVWTKNNAGMGSFYRSQHELVGVYSASEHYQNNIKLGTHGRYRTNVWHYPGANSFGPTRTQDLADHPTVKPKALIMDIIKDCTSIGDVVLDPFLGSGTTLLACQATKRQGIGVELDPCYVDVALRRLHDQFGLDGVQQSTGSTYSNLLKESSRG